MKSTPRDAAPEVAAVDPLRIVLFGLPAAGKTSLLGALAQAAQAQTDMEDRKTTGKILLEP